MKLKVIYRKIVHFRGDKMIKKAFTLSEVIIALGIIGIIAALIIPNVVENYQKRKIALAVKKSYVELNQVLQMAINDYGEPSTWDYQKSEELIPWVQKYIQPYVKVVSAGACTKPNSQCFGMNPLQTLSYDPKSNSANASVPNYIIVKNGPSMAWGFYRYSNWIWYEHTTRIRVWVRNPPEIQFWKYKYAYIGKDVFTFVLDINEKTPRIQPYNPVNYSGISNSRKVTREDILGTGWGGCNKKASGGGYWGPGDACAALIMLDDWKISNDYPWRKN